MDHPIRALDPVETFVELLETPRKLDLVVSNPDHVDQSEEVAVGSVLFSVPDEPIGERCFLALLLDQLVLVDAPVDKVEPICNVELAFFVHVQDPGVLVGRLLGGLVERACFEHGVQRGFLVWGHHNLAHLGVDSGQVHECVSHHLHDPRRGTTQIGVTGCALDVLQRFNYHLTVGPFAYESNVDNRFLKIRFGSNFLYGFSRFEFELSGEKNN